MNRQDFSSWLFDNNISIYKTIFIGGNPDTDSVSDDLYDFWKLLTISSESNILSIFGEKYNYGEIYDNRDGIPKNPQCMIDFLHTRGFDGFLFSVIYQHSRGIHTVDWIYIDEIDFDILKQKIKLVTIDKK